MTIAIVLEHLDPSRGGAETSATQLAHELSRLGHDVTLVVRRDTLSVAAAEQLTRDGESGVRIEALATRGVSRAAQTCAFLRSAAQVCRAGRFDIVHSLLPLTGCDVYQPRGGTYAATIRHSTLMLRQPWRSLRRLLKRLNARQQMLRRAEGALLRGESPPVVACVSRFVQRQVLELAPELPTERVAIVRNGVSIEPLDPDAAAAARSDWRRRLGLDPQTPLLLFCAHNLRLKGLPELRAALAHPAAGRDWHLIVTGKARRSVGPPPPTPRRAETPDATTGSHTGQPPPAGDAKHGGQPPSAGTRSVASDLRVRRDSRAVRRNPRRPLDQRVHFVGPQRDMPALYAAVDALVHPTWYDPCSRVVLEALCCGRPVVTTAFDGAAEVVEDGRDGRVIERPDDPAALCEAIADVLTAKLREQAARRADQRRETLSMERHARELLALYEGIVAGRS